MSPTDSQPERVAQRPARRWRWRPQFGLRTLLVGSLLIGVVVAKVAGVANDARRQREVVNRIEALDGGWDAEASPDRWARLDFLRGWLSDEYFDTITEVYLAEPEVSHGDVLAILSVAQDLRHLDLSGSNISDSSVAAIARIQSLENLYLDNTYVTANAIESLRGHPRLTVLSMKHANVTGEGLAALAELPALRELDLSGTPLGDDDVCHLVNASQVAELHLHYTRLTNDGLSKMAAMRPRTTLVVHLSGGTFTDAGIVPLRMIPALKGVSLDARKFTDRAVEILAACPSLEQLKLGDGQYTDACLIHLYKLRNLRELVVDGSLFSNDALDALQVALPQCKIACN